MLQKYNTWKVASVFFDEPTKSHRLRETSRRAKLAHTSVKTHLQALIKQQIVKIEKEKQGNRYYPLYKANYQSDEYKFYKRIDVLNRIKITKLVEHLEKEFTPDCIVLFGSSNKGEDTEKSDIDLFVQSKEKKINLEKYDKELKRKVQLHMEGNPGKYPKELQKNIINGTVLYGYLDICETQSQTRKKQKR